MNISKKQLFTLFICSLVPWIVGNGLLPLLPVYAAQLGANSAVSGAYLAISYAAIALGALSAGLVSGKLHRLKLPLIISTSIGIPAAWLMGRVTSVWSLAVLTAFLWFFGGMGLVLISILTGLSAGEHERGKIFGLMGLTAGLGAVIGGLGVGWLVDRWGYATMFSVVAVLMLIGPLSALFTEEKEVKPAPAINSPAQPVAGSGKSFYLLFTSTLLTSMAGFFINLIRSLMMDEMNFSPLEITSTGAIGGLVAMPFPFLMGWLSDRVSRKTIIFSGYLTALFALATLAFSKLLWHFWIALGLIGISTGTNNIGNALVNDLVPKESLGKSLSIYGSAAWIGGIAGFAIAGLTLQNLGLVPTLIIGGCLVLISVALLIPIREKARNTGQSEPEIS